MALTLERAALSGGYSSRAYPPLLARSSMGMVQVALVFSILLNVLLVLLHVVLRK